MGSEMCIRDSLCSSAVEPSTVNRLVPGSNPGGGVRANNSVVECLVYTEVVGGSNPSSPIIKFDFDNRIQYRPMLTVRCKECGKELVTHPSKTKCCGCSNMTTIKGDQISANDLSKVVIIRNDYDTKKEQTLSSADIEWQESRKKRKIRKLNFEIR